MQPEQQDRGGSLGQLCFEGTWSGPPLLLFLEVHPLPFPLAMK